MTNNEFLQFAGQLEELVNSNSHTSLVSAKIDDVIKPYRNS